VALLLKNGAVFVHIPKTGGTWVTSVLRDAGLAQCRIAHKHADLEHLRDSWKHYPTQLLKRTLWFGPGVQRRIRRGVKFCFVRHPIRWYESYFRYMKGLGWPSFGGLSTSRWHPNAELFDLSDETLEGFMRNVLDRCPGYLARMYEWFTGPVAASSNAAGPMIQPVDDHATACTYIGRQERLVEDLVAILDELGAPADEARVRATVPANVSAPGGDDARPTVWDAGLLRAVLDAEDDAMRRFGYEPDTDTR